MNDHSSWGVLRGKEGVIVRFPYHTYLQFVKDCEIAENSLRQSGEAVVFQGPLGFEGT